jgi:hypothetical protein
MVAEYTYIILYNTQTQLKFHKIRIDYSILQHSCLFINNSQHKNIEGSNIVSNTHGQKVYAYIYILKKQNEKKKKEAKYIYILFYTITSFC